MLQTVLLILIPFVLIIPFSILSKKFLIRTLKYRYEKCLLDGDEESATYHGRLYYQLLMDKGSKPPTPLEIENKISADIWGFTNLNH